MGIDICDDGVAAFARMLRAGIEGEASKEDIEEFVAACKKLPLEARQAIGAFCDDCGSTEMCWCHASGSDV